MIAIITFCQKVKLSWIHGSLITHTPHAALAEMKWLVNFNFNDRAMYYYYRATKSRVITVEHLVLFNFGGDCASNNSASPHLLNSVSSHEPVTKDTIQKVTWYHSNACKWLCTNPFSFLIFPPCCLDMLKFAHGFLWICKV